MDKIVAAVLPEDETIANPTREAEVASPTPFETLLLMMEWALEKGKGILA